MSEIHFDNDKALLIAKQLLSSDVDYKWAMQNPLWFLAVRDEDILQIHDKLWSGKRGTTFAQYIDIVRRIELALCSNQYTGFLAKPIGTMLAESTDMRSKFYRYYLATLFTPGLRLIDVSKKKMYCWNSQYFTKQKFRNTFEKAIDSRKTREFALLNPISANNMTAIDPYSDALDDAAHKSRIPNLINDDILNQLIVDKAVLKSSACKPLKYVYAIGWKEQDRLLDKSHYK